MINTQITLFYSYLHFTAHYFTQYIFLYLHLYLHILLYRTLLHHYIYFTLHNHLTRTRTSLSYTCVLHKYIYFTATTTRLTLKYIQHMFTLQQYTYFYLISVWANTHYHTLLQNTSKLLTENIKQDYLAILGINTALNPFH